MPFRNCVIPPNGSTLIKRECVPRGREGRGEGREAREGGEGEGRPPSDLVAASITGGGGGGGG